MPKKKEPEWIITKGQRSRWEKEQRRKRIAIIAGGAIIGIVLILVGVAIWQMAKPEPPTLVGIGIDPAIPSMKSGETLDLKAVKTYDNDKTKPINSDVVWTSSATPTATIDPITGRVTALKEGTTTITALWDGRSATALLGVVPTTVLQVGSTSFSMDDYVSSLRITRAMTGYDPSMIADALVTSIENSELRKQLAPTVGITVSNEEIEKAIVESWVSSVGGSGTPSYAEVQEQITQRLKPYEITYEQYFKQTESGLLTEKFIEYVGGQEVPKTADQVHLRGILFDAATAVSGTPSATPTPTPTDSGSPAATPDPAVIRQTIQARLDAGDSFTAVAQQYSKDTASKDTGGDLGWMPREIAAMNYGDEWAGIAFTLEPGTLSNPIPLSTAKTNTYYWVIEVTENETGRTIESTQWNMLAAQAENEWLTQKANELNIAIVDDALTPELRTWAANKAAEPFPTT
ncbi:MAG: hypothetical protein FJZ95_09775 [Chloroflexi bacterium]|nr:hypothetical protein [Chloroflexota bacterium]